jgi:aldehyde dehydrogenase (NAD+)
MQIFGRSVGGALAAGNVCVVKPSEDACLSLIRVAQLAAEVGFPAGAINIVTGFGHEVGDALARHPGIDHISFTGSPRVGTLIQQVAAERHCPVTLELGGKSPQIVFADADLDAGAAGGDQRHRAERRARPAPPARACWWSRASTSRCWSASARPSAPARGPAAMDLDVGPLIRASQQQRVWDFLSDAQHRRHPDGGAGHGGGRSARVRLLPGAHAAARRAGHAPPGAGGSVRAGAGAP